MSGDNWNGWLTGNSTHSSRSSRWRVVTILPFGAMACAGMAAAEVYKWVMRRHSKDALAPHIFAQLFAPAREATANLAPGWAQFQQREASEIHRLDLGSVDAVSGGAIIQAALFAIARIPGVTGRMRVIEPETSDGSNINRYGFLLSSTVGHQKAMSIAALPLGDLRIEPIVARFDDHTAAALGGLAPRCIVGVDHIPTRWAVQRANPSWLGIGAASHYDVMSSEHTPTTPCAWCAHSADSGAATVIPTVAFISHWGGLTLAARLVRHAIGATASLSNQTDYISPLRLDAAVAFWRSPVASRQNCPNGCGTRTGAGRAA